MNTKNTIIKYLKANPKANLCVTKAGKVEVHFNDEPDLMIYSLVDWEVVSATSIAVVLERFEHVVKVKGQSNTAPICFHSIIEKDVITEDEAKKLEESGILSTEMTHKEFVEYIKYDKTILDKQNEMINDLKVFKSIAKEIIKETDHNLGKNEISEELVKNFKKLTQPVCFGFMRS